MNQFVSLDFEKCKGCWLCLDQCPNDLIKETDKKNDLGYRTVEISPQEYCMGKACLNCVTVCPDNAFIKPENDADKLASYSYWIGKNIAKFIKK